MLLLRLLQLMLMFGGGGVRGAVPVEVVAINGVARFVVRSPMFQQSPDKFPTRKRSAVGLLAPVGVAKLGGVMPMRWQCTKSH